MKIRALFHFYYFFAFLSAYVMPLLLLKAADAFMVVPNSLNFVNGNAGSIGPFLIEQAGFKSMRYQQVYAASQFSALDGGGGYINSILVRADENNTHPIQSTVGNIQIDLSTTANGPDGLNSTFANNVGRDDHVVYSGSLPLRDVRFITIPLQHSFFYNPSQGNLLMDVRNLTGAIGPLDMNSPSMDAANVFGDSVSIVYATSVTAATGTANTVGLVTGFFASPVPEPGTIMMLSLGLPAILFAVYRKTKTSKRKGTNGING